MILLNWMIYVFAGFIGCNRKSGKLYDSADDKTTLKTTVKDFKSIAIKELFP